MAKRFCGLLWMFSWQFSYFSRFFYFHLQKASLENFVKNYLKSSSLFEKILQLKRFDKKIEFCEFLWIFSWHFFIFFMLFLYFSWHLFIFFHKDNIFIKKLKKYVKVSLKNVIKDHCSLLTGGQNLGGLGQRGYGHTVQYITYVCSVYSSIFWYFLFHVCPWILSVQ